MKLIIRVGSLLLILVAFVGCASMGGTGTRSGSSAWGKFLPDETVRRNVEAGNMDPALNYYYSGPVSRPNAIMGLNKKYVLDNKLWQPVSSPAMCKELCHSMMTADKQSNVPDLQGFTMLSPDGQKIGVWYSEINAKMMVKMGKGNKVIVYTPDQALHADEN